MSSSVSGTSGGVPPPGAGAPVAPPPAANATLLTNIQAAAGAFVIAMSRGAGVPRTMEAWQALAGEITKIVIDPATGVPDQTKAGALRDAFFEINRYCDGQLYGGGAAGPASPFAQYLLGVGVPGGSALPGIELFAKHATQVLDAIANNTGNILRDGFFPPGTTIVDLPIAAAGHGTPLPPAAALPPVQTSVLIQSTTGSPNLDTANLNTAILKTLLTPHRQAGLESCAIDSTIISETINYPARMAGMYRGLLTPTPRGTTGKTRTPAGTKVKLQQFTPFLGTRTFAGNANPFPMTNLDSMLVHSLANMLYENNDVSTQAAAYREAVNMPIKYLGSLPGSPPRTPPICEVFAVNASGSVTTGAGATVAASGIQTLARGRAYVPSHFNLTGFNHGQNFLGSAAAVSSAVAAGPAAPPPTIFTDTNWIDPTTGCPIYWQIDITAATYQAFTGAGGAVKQPLLGGSTLPLPPSAYASQGIYIMADI